MRTLLTRLPKIVLFCCCFNSTNVSAQTQRFTRSLNELGNSWNKIILPNDIYGHFLPPFYDLRVYGKTSTGDTVEAAYLIRSLKQSPVISKWSLPIINQSNTNGAYYYSFQVPSDSIVSRIQLDFGIRNYDWQVTLEGSDNGTDWFTVLSSYRLVAISNPETNFSYSTLNFQRVGYRLLRLKVPAIIDPLLSSATVQFQQPATALPEFYSTNLQQRISQENKKTIVDISLDKIMPVSVFLFELAETEAFKRSFSIEYVTDSTNNNGAKQYIYSILSAAALSSTTSALFFTNEVFAKSFRIIIENNDNAALNIQAVKPGGFGYELLVRVGKPGNYWMSYGDKSVTAPQYDIAAFVPASTDSFYTAAAGEETAVVIITPYNNKSFWSSPTFLWMLMGLIILLLGWFALSMIRNRQKESSG